MKCVILSMLKILLSQFDMARQYKLAICILKHCWEYRRWVRKRFWIPNPRRPREIDRGSGSFGEDAVRLLKFCRYFKVVIYFRSTVWVRVHGCPRSPILRRPVIDSNQHLAGITRETKWGSRQRAIWSVIFNYPNDIHRQNLSHPSGQGITIDNVCLKTGL